MQALLNLLHLPSELHVLLFSHLHSFADLSALTQTCRYLHTIFHENRVTILNPIANRTIPAFHDALRAVRARDLPKDQQCCYDAVKNTYINIPSASFCQELANRKPTLSEIQAILHLEKLLYSWRNVDHYQPAPYAWWSTWYTARAVDEDIRVWTPKLEERYRRGAYRTLLLGYLFGPGVFSKPIHDLAQHIMQEGGAATNQLLALPVFDWTDPDRRNHWLTIITSGFWEWVATSGENNAARGVHTTAYFYSEDAEDRVWKKLNHKEYSGLCEMLLIHTLHRFLQFTYEPLKEFQRRQADKFPGVEITTYMPFLQRPTVYRIGWGYKPVVERPETGISLVMRTIETRVAFSFANNGRLDTTPFEAIVNAGLVKRYGLKIPEESPVREHFWGFIESGELPLVVA